MPFRSLKSTGRQLAFVGAVLLGGVSTAAAQEGEGYSLREDLAFWGVVAFVGFVWVLYKLGWGPLVRSMSERERQEREMIDRAEESSRQAQEAFREHRGRMEAVDEEVRELIAEAHRDAEHTREELLAAARREADVLRKRAVREIERARDQALDEMFQVFSEQVVSGTQRRLAERLRPDDQDRLIDEALRQLERQRH